MKRVKLIKELNLKSRTKKVKINCKLKKCTSLKSSVKQRQSLNATEVYASLRNASTVTAKRWNKIIILLKFIYLKNLNQKRKLTFHPKQLLSLLPWKNKSKTFLQKYYKRVKIKQLFRACYNKTSLLHKITILYYPNNMVISVLHKLKIINQWAKKINLKFWWL